MSKFTHKIKNMFKSKEQLEIEARMQFNQNKRAFTKYYQELDASIRNFSRMAQEAELGGNHENATSCAKFVAKLQRTQVKVQSLLQRFEMMYSMQRLSGVMTNFVDACTEMGFNMDSSIDLKKMWRSTAEMDQAISKLDAMSDQMDMIFDTIDAGMSTNGQYAPSKEEEDAEAEQMLDRIMGRYNTVNAPAQQAAQAQDDQQTQDDTDERLRKMIQELKN